MLSSPAPQQPMPRPPSGRPPSALRRPRSADRGATKIQPRAHGDAPFVSPEPSVEDDDGVRSFPVLRVFGLCTFGRNRINKICASRGGRTGFQMPPHQVGVHTCRMVDLSRSILTATMTTTTVTTRMKRRPRKRCSAWRSTSE